MNTVDNVWQYIRDNAMLTPSDTVIVGFSGGADSLALLHILLTLQKEKGFPARIVAAHLQHNLRGEEGIADEQFVRSFCRDNGIECRVKSVDVPAAAAEWSTSLEDAGRRARYAFFLNLATEFAPAKIATAHNRRDNAETVLLHLTRGSGLQGVGGIEPAGGAVIRPLLCLSRPQIESYCDRHGLAYRQDSTNQDITYSRNRVRHRVLPELEHINPQVEEALMRFSADARQDDDFLETMAQSLVNQCYTPSGYLWEPIVSAARPIRSRALRRIVWEETGVVPERQHVEGLSKLGPSDDSMTLPGGRQAVTYQGLLCFPPSSEIPFQPVPAVIGEPIVWGGKRYVLSQMSREKYENQPNVHKILLKNTIDCAMICGSLVWQPRQAGETFRPYGRPTKTLKKWFNEWEIPPWLREDFPLLKDDNGILWVEPGGVAQHAAVTPQTETVLLVEVRPL